MNNWIIKIIGTLLNPIEYSGEHRRDQWEKGWQENVDENSIVPHYFGKYPVIRKGGKLVKADAWDEYHALCDLEKKVFSKYLKKSKHIIEVGCGTGHNLVRAQEVNPTATIGGLDWAGSAVESVRRLGFHSAKFDIFNPDFDFKGVSVFTVAALEQTGTNFKRFVDLLVEQKAEICVHLEPIEELMDRTVLLDFLCAEYIKKRKYLTGFLTYLRELEKNGKIEILEASRNGVGSLFIEGYSLIVWRPL